MKKIIALCLLATLLVVSSACSTSAADFTEIVSASQSTTVSGVNTVSTDQTHQISESISTPITVEYDSEDIETEFSSTDISTISLEGDAISFVGSGASVNGTVVTIQSAGTYNISGILNDGQIIVDTQDEETVNLVLNGIDINSGTSAPIYVKNAEKTVITLATGTENYVSDGASYIFENTETDEPNAAIFSKDDLTINGDGSLTVTAKYNNGIDSNDDLLITSGSITINAVNDGIKGKDSIAILAGNITINAGGDGMQSNNDEEPGKGYIAIENGTFNITAGLDGIQAETQLQISGGVFTIRTAGGNAGESAKGIKAGVDLTITAGSFDISAADDALHSNHSLTIADGVLVLASGDDGIHAETSLTINGGNISVIQSFEGFESALITINDGTIHLVTNDDGINATTGAGGGQTDSSYFYFNGGYVLVDAGGDGLDSNGNAVMAGGVVIVQGPTMNNNGPLDVNGELEVNGGLLIVAGSAGMPEIPSTSSTQNSIALVLDSTQPGGTLVHIESESGEEILTFEPFKDYQLFVFSSPELQANTTYNVYIGGEATGTVTDGLYSNNTYTAGTQVASLEISSNVTTSGSFDSSGGRKGGGRP